MKYAHSAYSSTGLDHAKLSSDSWWQLNAHNLILFVGNTGLQGPPGMISAVQWYERTTHRCM